MKGVPLLHVGLSFGLRLSVAAGEQRNAVRAVEQEEQEGPVRYEGGSRPRRHAIAAHR